MPLQHPILSRRRRLELMLWSLALAAAGLAACTNPRELAGELTPGSIPGAITVPGKPSGAPWQPQLSVMTAPDGSRRLTAGEGEFVVSNAIAAHEMRRP
jgi:hypothetical protein